MSRNQEDHHGEQLDQLFAAYREACVTPEPGVNFMPEVWSRIEARRSVSVSLRRWAQAFVLAGAAACAMLGALLVSPLGQSRLEPKTYVEVLEEDQSPDRLVFEDIALREHLRPAFPANWEPDR